ncbi:MAG: 4Fe-4S dicluster domain-containing protein [Clostridiales bacterium]|nr:4Fe-4S dicluster domain-containing protein [Clostridiales bacterium]
MIYKDFKNLKLSALGLGCMRLPVNGDYTEIDEKKTAEMVDYAIKNGINYFDTAWGYHGGQSELVMGRVLKNYARESFYLASKFPGYDLANIDKVEEIFTKQLEKCQVDYFDFYLFHNVCELNIEQYLDEKYRIYDYLIKQKREGRIRHLGFSTHGTIDTMRRFLEKYGKDMEFCQLQVNWLDWDFQNAKEKVKLVKSYGIPVWVMEPVRGGSLVNLAPKYAQKLRDIAPNRTFAEWAFRFLQGIDEVTVTLSGMSNFEQLKENIQTYTDEKPLNAEEREVLLEIAYEMTHKNTLPCTSCRYCTEKCPKELNIPWLIELYNEHTYSDGGFIASMAMDALSEDKKPSACIGCRACESVCPQNIKISEMMADFSAKIK